MLSTTSPQTASRPFKTCRTITALILREMATTYGRSALGYLWAIAEPVGGIALLTVIFAVAFHAPPIGDSFPLFYASGILPFMMYFDTSKKIETAIRFSKPLLYYPGVTYIDAILARMILGTLTQILVVAIGLVSIIVIWNLNLILHVPTIGLALAMAAALALGVGTLNCYLISVFPFWERIWAILNRPMFIVSAIVFLFDSVPEPYRSWLWFNPLIHVTGLMREGVFATYDAHYASPVYVFGVSGVCLAAGLLLLGRYHRDIINN